MHFTGKMRDIESNLDDFDARYYSSQWGRFMIPDWDAKPASVPYAKFGDPQSLNLYSYVQNNPTASVDPDGHNLWDVVNSYVRAITVKLTMAVGFEEGVKIPVIGLKGVVGGSAGYSLASGPDARVQTSVGGELSAEAKVPGTKIQAGGAVTVSEVTSTLHDDYSITGTEKPQATVSPSAGSGRGSVSTDENNSPVVSLSGVEGLGPKIEVGVDRNALGQANSAAKNDPQVTGPTFCTTTSERVYITTSSGKGANGGSQGAVGDRRAAIGGANAAGAGGL